MGTLPFVFRDNSESKTADKVGSVEPDICLFHTGDRNKGNFFNIKKQNDDQLPSYTAHMGEVYLFSKVEREAGQDVFTDPPATPYRTTDLPESRGMPQIQDFCSLSDGVPRPRCSSSPVSNLRVFVDDLWKHCSYNALG